MAKLPKPDALRWLDVSDRRQMVVCLSDAEPWVSHWDSFLRRSVRCGGSLCALCALGLPKVFRYVCLVQTREGGERLFEFRARHVDEVEAQRTEKGGLVGTQMVVYKNGVAKNSPVELVWRGKTSVVPRSIVNLVASLGLPPRFVGSDSSALSGSEDLSAVSEDDVLIAAQERAAERLGLKN